MGETSHCRLCADTKPTLDLMAIKTPSTNNWDYTILHCFHLEINNDDNLPKHICGSCSDKLNSTYLFFEQIQLAQQILRITYESLENKSDIKVEEADLDTNTCFSPDVNIDTGSETEINVRPKTKRITKQTKRSGRAKLIRREKINGESEEEPVDKDAIELMKVGFYARLSRMKITNNGSLITDPQYEKLIEEVEEAKTRINKVSRDYRRLARFEVLISDNKKQLIVPMSKSQNIIRYYIPTSQMFDAIHEAHIQCNHGGRIRTEAVLKMTVKNVPRDLIMVYINLCRICQERRGDSKKKSGINLDEDASNRSVHSDSDNENRIERLDSKLGHLVKQEKHGKQIKRTLLEAWKSYKWKCKECDDLLPSVKCLRDHYMTDHKKPVQYMCMECPRISNNYITFRNHLLGHRNKYRFQCNICNNYYSSSRKLRSHKETHSEVRRKYICSICGKGFLNESYLSIHARKKHKEQTDAPESSKTYECDGCHKYFASISSLNNHKKVHSGVKDHICEHCGKSFVYKKYLDDHITSHSDERPYKCELCPASFKARVYLRRHQFLHSGIKPFQCDICGKKFPRKPALIEHSITHTDLYPFKCDICNKGFRAKKNVISHQRLHTGERPYSCGVCNRHFTCSSNYDKHMKRLHGITKVKREIVEVNRN